MNPFITPPKYLVFLGPEQGYVASYEVWTPDWKVSSSASVLIHNCQTLTAMAVSLSRQSIYLAVTDLENYPVIQELLLVNYNQTLMNFRGVGKIEGLTNVINIKVVKVVGRQFGCKIKLAIINELLYFFGRNVV